MNELGRGFLLATCATVCVGLAACAYDASSRDDYEVPQHIRERQTLRQDPYADPRPNNAPTDAQRLFLVPDPGATQTGEDLIGQDSSLDRHRRKGAQL